MHIHTPLTFSSAAALGVLAFRRIRLLVVRQFQAFEAVGMNIARTAPVPWLSAFSRVAPVVSLRFSLLVSGSNPAVKLTRQRRAAYFVR